MWGDFWIAGYLGGAGVAGQHRFARWRTVAWRLVRRRKQASGRGVRLIIWELLKTQNEPTNENFRAETPRDFEPRRGVIKKPGVQPRFGGPLGYCIPPTPRAQNSARQRLAKDSNLVSF